MPSPLRRALALSLALHLVSCGSTPDAPGAAPGPGSAHGAALIESGAIAAKTAKMQRLAGFLELWIENGGERIWLAVPPPGPRGVALEALYVESLASGLGSNPVGLDRGQLGATRLLELRRVGNKVLFEEPNLAYRARSIDPAERRAARESFATSVLWAGKVEALEPDGRALVDLTSFVLRDAHGVAATLEGAGQGTFHFDVGRSALDVEACLAFPDNVELEALLTFAGTKPGAEVRATVPSAEALSLVQHHSFVRPPDAGYRPRAFEPRAGAFALEFVDYAAGLDESARVHLAVRHRLEKTDPGAERSEVFEPIVYYVDRGAPEPVRTALVEGASWWAEAFDAAGFVNAFRVELLPEDAHPLDVRYNVIQWVHRATRGWSYGGGMSDPRTGEMIKGHVSLGSLRVRQDRLLFEGLAGTARTGTGLDDDPVELALARIRQLSAHEVGHTLGLAHNFAASTYGRASVMDYPAPLVTLKDDGSLDFSEVYGVGIGAWDRLAIRHLYTQFPPGADEAAALERIVLEGIGAGMLFLSDADARPPGAADARGSLWDNGQDAAQELERVLAVRAVALERFGIENLQAGRPLAELEEVLTPLYLHHRYQLEAATKRVAGVSFQHARRGDADAGVTPVAAEDQRRALAAVLSVLERRVLDLSESTLELLHPRPPGWGPSRELFGGHTSPVFDSLGAARGAADAVVAGLLQRDRAARLVDQARRDAATPGLDDVIEALGVAVFEREAGSEREAALDRVVQQAVVDGLMRLAADGGATAAVRARAEAGLHACQGRAEQGSDAQSRALAAGIARFLAREWAEPRSTPAQAALPPGSPIGGGAARAAGCSFRY